MLFNVPQYIDVEDKIAGPFTAKQLLWMFGMGAALLLLWGFLEKTAFYMAAVPVIIIFLALAFYRPYNQPLISFIIHSIMFVFRPKLYFWKREAEHEKAPAKQKDENIFARKKGRVALDEDKIKMFAKILDTRGQESNERILEIIKERTQRKK